ncbi:MAG: XTP/dITP diphosphatase [Candidatus Micrarchaeota archaeon]
MGSVLFVTGNKHKFQEAERVLKLCGVSIEHRNTSYPEIRAENCEEIALNSAKELYEKLRKPLFVEDAGLFIEALNGFPGTYSAWVFKKLGIAGVLELMRGEKNRHAEFVSAVAYSDENGVKLFVGKCKGSIACEERGKGGFGFDPVFIPDGEKKTFAEEVELKKCSHRTKAVAELGEWLKRRNKN